MARRSPKRSTPDCIWCMCSMKTRWSIPGRRRKARRCALAPPGPKSKKIVRDRFEHVLSDAERQKYSAEIVTLIGSPFLEIVTYAKAQDIDLIVMGTHGRGPIAHMLMGSVAEKVVRKAPCPVLTVRHPEHEFIE